MSKPEPWNDITSVLNAPAAEGRSPQDLAPLVYRELAAAARAALATERRDHTLSATALVHEAYVRVSGSRRVPWQSRYHFFAAAAETMRRVLIDHARSRGRSPARRPMRLGEITDLMALASADAERVLRFDELYRELQASSPDPAEVLRLRLFAGLTIEQAADVLGISASTVERRWAFARAWLHKRLAEDEADAGGMP